MGSPPRVHSHNLPLAAAYDAYASFRGRTVHVRDLKEHLTRGVWSKRDPRAVLVFAVAWHGAGGPGAEERPWSTLHHVYLITGCNGHGRIEAIRPLLHPTGTQCLRP